jgi:hypothetical protein
VESFDGLATGALDGLHGWAVDPAAAALVQTNVTHARSAKACRLTNTAGEGNHSRAGRAFAPGTATNVVWSEWVARPQPMSVIPVVPDEATTAFYVNAAGNLVAFDGNTATVIDDGPRISPGTWSRFRVRADYGTRRWDLWVDGSLARAGLSFHNTNITQLASFNVLEGAVGRSSYLDDVRLWVPTPPAAGTTWTIPFSEPFEAVEWGALDGQRGWEATGAGSAVVQGAVVRSGQGGLRLAASAAGGAQVRHEFGAGGKPARTVFTSWYAKPRRVSRTHIGPDRDASVAFYVRTDGKIVVLDGRDEVVLTQRPSVSEDEWVFFQVAADYSSRTWALWMDGVPMAQDIGFYNPATSRFAAFGVEEGDATPSYIDSLRIVTSMGAVMFIR